MEADHSSTNIEPTPLVEKKESTKRKKKNAENIGSFIVESEPAKEKENKAPAEKADGIWSRLKGREAKTEEQKPEKSESEVDKLSDIDKTPELDAEASVNHITPVEAVAIVQAIGGERDKEVAAELADAEPETLAAEQAEAVKTYTESLIENGDIEAAMQEVAAKHGLDPIEISPEDIAEADAEIPDELQEPDAEVIDMNEPAEGEIQLNTEPDAEQAEAIIPPAAGGGGAHGGVGQPPHGPGGFGGMPPSAGDGSGQSVPDWSPYAINRSASTEARPVADPDMISVSEANYQRRRATGGAFLVGGILGYLMGRRRGRIKTEKKLLPVQQRLEKEVKGLQTRLIESEYAVRRAVAQKEQNAVSARKSVTELAKKPEQRLAGSLRAERDVQRQPHTERPITAMQERVSSVAKAPLEHIGQVIISAEAISFAIPKSREKAITQAPVSEKPRAIEAMQPRSLTTSEHSKNEKLLSPEKQAMTMSRQELMLLSEKIVVDGANLRQVYETHLVGERGLRRLVSEYLQGGDIKRALRRELIEREIDFERDPQLRDRARSSVSGAGKGALTNLLHEAGATVVFASAHKQSMTGDVSSDSDTQGISQKHHIADISIITIIIILLLLIIFLVSTHY